MSDDKRDLRILIALIVAALGIGAAVFGVVRGLSKTGPAHGVRLTVMIAPPLDSQRVELATRVVKERCDEKGIDLRVVPAGDRVVMEVGEDDPEIVGNLVALIERRAALEVRDDKGTVLTGAGVTSAEVASGGVAIGLRAPVTVAEGTKLTFLLDGKVKTTAILDHVAATDLHVAIHGATEEAAMRDAIELAAMVEAGAVPALHVSDRTAFSRATGFLPRAWPFFAICAVMLLVAGFVARRRR